ncbi:helix-turn-helix transcriptional regulator [Paenibacillus sp. S-38]|uniref:helix-turn-helix transcriptional regulator n=1 Tax=Paenibacillus sp. S-38 TaxID=3416710 RepID=UPI003CF2A0F5
MNKAQRLLHILMTMQAHRKFNLKELTEEFGVSKRTILRDLQELSELGVPLYSELGVHGGYQLLRERMLPPIHFSDKEAVALFLVAESLKGYPMLPFEAEVESALKKFYHYSPRETKEKIERLRSHVLFHVQERGLDTPHLTALLEASLEGRIVTITYESEKGISQRDIQPIGVYTASGLWYCPAYCFRSQDTRLFRADRITALAVSGDQSRRIDPAGFDIRDWVAGRPGEETAELVIHLSRAGVIRAKSDPMLADGLTVHEDGTGCVRRRAALSDLACLADTLLGYGAKAEVEAPEQLREMLLRRVQEIRELYADAGDGSF